ncbi:MAG: hypothetical protein NT068_02730 [Candidatus Nomurabacteria bacterium]|nr:hypothetical protein [Candidatus Nomurabacteria bacterium]
MNQYDTGRAEGYKERELEELKKTKVGAELFDLIKESEKINFEKIMSKFGILSSSMVAGIIAFLIAQRIPNILTQFSIFLGTFLLFFLIFCFKGFFIKKIKQCKTRELEIMKKLEEFIALKGNEDEKKILKKAFAKI